MKYKVEVKKGFGCEHIKFNDIDITAVFNGSTVQFCDPDAMNMVRNSVTDIDSAISFFAKYLIEHLEYPSKSFVVTGHGGKRTGAGRKKSPEIKKPYRLTDKEIQLIKNIRSSGLIEAFLDKSKTAESLLDFL